MNSKLSMDIDLPMAQIQQFCQRWQVVEFALFGSVLREDFSPLSDIDCLVKFSNQADWSLFDRVKMQQELTIILDREVDLVNKNSIEQSPNWLRKKAILDSAKTIYVHQ